MNPPYGRQIGKWVKKAYEESRNDADIVVCLLPSRTDTKWFQDYILPFAKIQFIRGRLKFGKSKNAAPFPSLIAIFGR
jgi:site-specific DNA-methyltransferase (adenine-specific)